MSDDPYQPPEADSVEDDATGSPQERPIVRRGALWILAVAWNVPLLIILASNFSGWISEQTMGLLIAGCVASRQRHGLCVSQLAQSASASTGDGALRRRWSI